jgi:hypothetical protein
MDVKGAHKFIKNKGYKPQVVEMATFSEQTKFHVDLLGSFYPVFLSKFFLHESHVASSIVLKQLEKRCPKDGTILYLDSGRPKKKK